MIYGSGILPLAVHSGVNSEDFLSYLGGLWGSLGKAWQDSRTKLLRSLAAASSDTQYAFLEQISAARLEMSKN